MVKKLSLIPLFLSLASSAAEEPRVLDLGQQRETRSLRPNIRCSRNENEDVCLIKARLDGNPLEMITYCPVDSVTLEECECSVTHFGQSCNMCSYCANERVFIVDCSNVVTNNACASVNCHGVCLAKGSGTTSSRARNSGSSKHGLSHDAVAAIVVFSTMCCLPCLTAMVCARILPANDHYSSSDSNTSYFGNQEERQAVIDKCLLTKEVDQEGVAENETGGMASPTPSTVMSISSNSEASKSEEEFSVEENGTTPIADNAASEDGDGENLIAESDNGEITTATVGESSIMEDAEDTTLNDDDSADEDICQICLDRYKVGDERSWSRVSKCKHSFHRNCITTWLQKHDDCPSCRAKFLSVSAPDDIEDCNI